MIEFSRQQLDYIAAPLAGNIYLRACPGSGKTEVIAAKIAKEIRAWSRFPAGIAVLSFSRSATAELEERVASALCGSRGGFPHFIGTVDSFLLKQIVTPCAHRLTGYQGRDGDYTIRVVDEHAVIYQRTKYAIEREHIPANRFDWDRKANRYVFRHPVQAKQRVLNALRLDGWQVRDLALTKAAFIAKGFATYKDIERLAHEILNSEECAPYVECLVRRFPHIVIDECQDLSADQIAIFAALAIKGVTFHLVGDLNQAIYGFRNCRPDDVLAFINALGCTPMSLSENFRSGQTIVDLHGMLVRADKSDGRKNFAQVTCLLWEYRHCPSELLPEFDQLAKAHTRSVIVARGHGTLNRMRLGEPGESAVETLAGAIATFARNRKGDLYAGLAMFAEYLSEQCIAADTHGHDEFFRPVDLESHEAWHRFLSECLAVLIAGGLADQAGTWTAWCSKLKLVLKRLVDVQAPNPTCKLVLKNLSERNHRAPKGKSKDQVAMAIPADSPKTVVRRLATIHEVKGQTHDLTMLVSSTKSGEDSHWKEWLEDPQTEAARFAYVASSRPKNILIWAVKSISPADRHRLMALGFQQFVPSP